MGTSTIRQIPDNPSQSVIQIINSVVGRVIQTSHLQRFLRFHLFQRFDNQHPATLMEYLRQTLMRLGRTTKDENELHSNHRVTLRLKPGVNGVSVRRGHLTAHVIKFGQNNVLSLQINCGFGETGLPVV